MSDNRVSDLDLYVAAALEKKSEDVVVLDLTGLTAIADVFIICSGRSNRQTSAIADHIERTLKAKGIQPLSVEGKGEGHWVLIDYGHVVMHVFYSETRSFYDLEGLWSDAKRVVTQSMQAQPQNDDQGFDGEEVVIE
jgi:ribosome-associated protein